VAKTSASTQTVEVLDGVVPMDDMQKAMGKNMEATLAVPVFRVSGEILTDDFDELYAKLKPTGINVSAMLTKAVAVVQQKHLVTNAAYVEGGTSTTRMLTWPWPWLLMEALSPLPSSMPRTWISSRWGLEGLGRKTNAKKLSPAEYTSGSFTISNLLFGVQLFDAPPGGTGSILAIAVSRPNVVQLFKVSIA